MLFTDVLNCVQTGNIELKKLVYLYLINYAKSQPELTLLAVNTFVKDANDPNPLIRALAVRTMGCIRVDRITEYLCEPLSRALRDEDPYVRKTAAVCVAKLFDIAPGLVQERGFLEILHDLISDSNPSVVANGVAALSEIAETSGKDVMKISAAVLQKLLAALNECTEWGQVFILEIDKTDIILIDTALDFFHYGFNASHRHYQDFVRKQLLVCIWRGFNQRIFRRSH